MANPAPETVTHRHTFSQRRVTLLIVVVLLGALLASSGEIHRRIVSLFALAEPLLTEFPLLGAAIFVGLAALSAMLVFVSSAVLAPVGVQVWGELGSFLLLWSGWALGGIATYGIGRLLGAPVVARLLPQGAMARYEGRIPRDGSFLTVVLIQLALPSDVTGYFFGLLGFPFRRYLAALLVAELPYALGTVFLGAAFMKREPFWLLGVAALALGVLAWTWLRRRRA